MNIKKQIIILKNAGITILYFQLVNGCGAWAACSQFDCFALVNCTNVVIKLIILYSIVSLTATLSEVDENISNVNIFSIVLLYIKSKDDDKIRPSIMTLPQSWDIKCQRNVNEHTQCQVFVKYLFDVVAHKHNFFTVCVLEM